ncbi:MAG: hypothetical protein R3F59_26390 [Myxococcota bacterium]
MTVRLPALALLTGLAACDLDAPPPGGTSVGNPGKTTLSLARIDGMDLTAASATGLAVSTVGCAGGLAEQRPDDGRSLLDGDPLPLDPGTWCAVVVTLGTVSAAGHTPGTGETTPVAVELAPELPVTLWASAPVVVDETDTVLELGAPGWLDVTGREPVEGGILVGPEGELAQAATLELVRGTAWFEDIDGDGVLSDDERAAGPLATALRPPPTAVAADTGDTSIPVEGCQCDAGGARSPGGLLLVGLLALRRRYSSSRR